MKKTLAALGWLILFAATGAAAMLVLANVLLRHRLQLGFYPGIAATGAVPGVLAWVIALCFAALPGARRAPGVMQHFGLMQALWGMCGTLLMMLCGAILPFMAAVYLMLTRILRHLPSHMPDRHDIALLITSLLASELMAALWLSWYVRRQGPAVAQNGSATGIAWRAATPRAYAMAALGALAILLLAVAEFRLIPPDLSKLHDMELAQLFQGPPAVALLAAAVIVIMAPIIEEVLFRGLAFAGIAARLGPAWAVIITTLIFTALHAPEKLLYLPGFADVAAVALLSCGLRLRYRSIRPGIAMHFMYNFGMLIVPVLGGGH
jgi:membrane protease YdiL (CAAX protease family)